MTSPQPPPPLRRPPPAASIIEALEPPAALIDRRGAVQASNAAFRALDPAQRPPAATGDAWSLARLADGAVLAIAADPRVARRARMLSTLSHEIRTPLNGVLGMANLLARTPLDATQAAYLSALRESGEHLLGLVSDVLDYARLDAGRLELEEAPVDVERLVRGVCELLSPRAHAGGVEIAWGMEGAAPHVLADDGRLRQILFNLAGNAVKLTRSGGVLVTARARAAARGRVRLRLAVRDTGPGLSPEAQARVFEEFEQDEAGARAGGAGLGLAIVRRLADAFGGELTVQSRAGEGALFAFEADFAAAAPVGRSEAADKALAGVSVALASASPVVTAAAAMQVSAAGGRPVIAAPGARAKPRADVRLVDGASAPARAPSGPPSLILLAPEERERIAAARAGGYAGYLIKPLRRASVALRIRAVLADGAAAPPAEDERESPAAAAGARVLLAEDNPVNALLARALLEREGCEVERAASGQEACEAAARTGFDLILMDLRMPGMDGLAAARTIRALGVDAPIVALTANAFEDDRRACREAGMDDFLTKPMDAGALRTVLARWTGARPKASAAA